MVEFENECVGCVSSGLPCMGSACPNRHVPHYFCDECGDEAKLYEYEGSQYCERCVLQFLTVVPGSE